MRNIHADLVNAQQSGAADPYLYLEIGGVDYSPRIISLEHTEEPYREYAVIILANSDRYFYSHDLRGNGFFIGYGYVTATGNRYTGDGSSDFMPGLWVKSQSCVSMEGQLVCILECEGMWAKLREVTFATTALSTEFDYPLFNIRFRSTDTVYQLINKALASASLGFSLIVESIDDIIQSFKPDFIANPDTFDSAAVIIKFLIYMTKCFLRPTHSLNFEVVYPQEVDTAQETYYSNQAPYFKEYVEKTNLLLPNSIKVFCNMNEDKSWSDPPMLTGTASDADSIAAYGEVIEYNIAPFITNQGDADNRAEAILARYKAETLSGRLVLPFHDCRLELYDCISIVDERGT